MWKELEKDVAELNVIEVKVQESQISPVTFAGSESLSASAVETTTVSFSEGIDRIGDKDKLMAFVARMGKRIEDVEEGLKTASLDDSYTGMVRQKLEGFSRKVAGILNQLETLDLSDDQQYALLPLVSDTKL